MGKTLKDLGWVSVKEQMPPFGERVVVTLIVYNSHGDWESQGIWEQSFDDAEEVKASGITHWGVFKKDYRLLS